MVTISSISELQTGMIRTVQGGRIDYVSSDQIQWSPYKMNLVGIYDGHSWVPVSPSSNIDFYASYNDYDGLAISSDNNYDVYAKFISSTSFSLELVSWASDTARNSSTWKLFQGIRVYDLSDEGKTMRYLGSVRLKILDTELKFVDDLYRRLVVNLNNVVIKTLRTYHSNSSSDTQTTGGTWKELFDGGQTRAEFLVLDSTSSVGGPSIIGHEGDRSTDADSRVGWAMNITNGRTGVGMRHMRCNIYNYEDNESNCIGFGAGKPNVGYNYVTQTFSTFNNCGIDVDGGATGAGMVLMVAC